MPTAIEVTKTILNSDSRRRMEDEKVPLEDCIFLNFTEFLDELDHLRNPTVARASGTYKNGNWSTLGYSAEASYQVIEEDIDEDDENRKVDKIEELRWEYTIINGLLKGGISAIDESKVEVDKLVNQTVRFLEKTFDKDYIKDFNETKDLQHQLINAYEEDKLDRVDICIISDNLIKLDKVLNKVQLKNADIECRIRYYDIKRWDALKRSKSKREKIEINFKSDDFRLYEIPFLRKEISVKYKYFLAIFPGDLIADLYSIHNTRLLENNVRLYLSANKKANKSMLNTINGNDGSNSFKFFSYNNGISATAESIEITDNRITKITDFQIVNGGQTTHTLHLARTKKSDLSNVFVAVKITALKNNENFSSIVNEIARAANTQSAVAESDFLINDKILIEIERLAAKNPTTDEFGLSLNYFFERMKGQHKVFSANDKRFERNNPKPLMFTKIELARWYNIANGLPHVAASGAEKQFKEFIEDTNFQRPEMSVGRLKTIIGLGLLFKRIKKLCGTAKGVDYPSLTIDPSTGTHAPVAMSTALYSASYIHLITSGRFDYHAIFNFEHGLVRSILNPKVERTDLDEILESVIEACWIQISRYGGAAAQEKTKKIDCWEYVKANININESIINRLDNYVISEKEKKERETLSNENNDSEYFDNLNKLIENNGKRLSWMLSVTSNQTSYYSIKRDIELYINKINRGNNLTIKRTSEIRNHYDNLIGDGFSEDLTDNIFEDKIDVDLIFNSIFKNQKLFIEVEENKILECDEDKFENAEKSFGIIKEIIGKFEREYALDINDLITLTNYINN